MENKHKKDISYQWEDVLFVEWPKQKSADFQVKLHDLRKNNVVDRMKSKRKEKTKKRVFSGKMHDDDDDADVLVANHVPPKLQHFD